MERQSHLLYLSLQIDSPRVQDYLAPYRNGYVPKEMFFLPLFCNGNVHKRIHEFVAAFCDSRLGYLYVVDP